MATIDDLRSLFPDAQSDSDLIKQAATRYGIDPMEIASELGIKVSTPGLWTSVKRGTGQVQSALGSTARDLGLDRAGRALESYGEDVTFRNPAAVNTVGEALSSPWQTAKEAVGELVPQVGFSAATALGGRMVGGALGAPLGPAGVAAGQALGGSAGALLGNLAQEYGGIRAEQRESGRENKTRALTTGAAAAVLDTAVGAERLVNKVGNKGLDILSRGAGEKLAPHVLKQTGLGAIGEAGTEAAQTALERTGAFKDLTGEDALNEYGMAAIKGGIGGGVIRGGMSLFAGQRQAEDSGNDVSQAFTQKDATQPDITTAQFTPPAAPVATREVVTEDGEIIQVPIGQQAPAVAGGSTEIAQAQQQAQQQAAQQQAQAQQAQAADQAAQQFGVVNPATPAVGSAFGQKVYGPNIPAVANAIATFTSKMPATQVQLAQAITKANAETGGQLIKFKFNANDVMASVDKGFQAVGKVANQFQIAHVGSVDEAAAILDDQSTQLKGDKLEQVNAIHQALTGQDTTGYQAEQLAKGAKDDKLQLQNDAGLREVPVTGGATEAIAGGDGAVRPAQVQPVGATSVGAGPIDEQAGQLPAGGVRPSTGDVSNVGGGQAPSSQVIEGANVQAAQGNDGGRESGQPKQADNAQVDSQGVRAGPRRYAEPTSYYATDLAHIKGERRIEIIKQLFAAALAPKTARKNTVPAETRAEFLRLALMEQLPHKTIAELTGVKLDTVEKQLERMGVELVDGQFEMTDPTLAQSFVSVAADYRSPEFPDGLGEAEVLALYTTRYEADEVEGQTLAEEIQAGEQEGKPQAKLAEELYSKDNAETKTMGTISSAGGSQGAVEATDDAFFAKVGRLQALLDTTPETDEAGRANLAKQIEAQWAQYAKKQANRAETGEVEVAPTEDEDAVQEPSAEEVPVRKRAKGGKAVGKGDAKGGKAAAEGEAKDNADEAAPEIKTPREQYEALAESTKVLPPYDSLDARERAQVEDQAHQGELTLASLNTMFSGNAKFGIDTRATNPYTAAELTKEIEDFIRNSIPSRKLLVVDSIEDLVRSTNPTVQKLGAVMAVEGAYGVASNGRAYLVANRIEKGLGRAKFMHEVGAHLGLENLLPKAMYDKLTQQIVDWAKQDEDSIESVLAVRAAERVMNAETAKEDRRAEMLAYFIEEAVQMGIDPTAAPKTISPINSWFRTLWAAFKAAIRKLGFNPETMTARDVVDMAFGAARLEMAGTYHGTAATFRKFNHKFMNTGEGAQAYGWGSYLAQRFGIAKGYFKADVARKASDTYYVNGEAVEPNSIEAFAASSIQGLKARGLSVDFMRQHYERNIKDPSYAKRHDVVAGLKKALEYINTNAEITGGVPEGSLMRVDVGVDQKDMLNWDTKLSEQPAVLKKITETMSPDFIQELETEVGDGVEDMTGNDFYRGLEFMEKKEGLVSEQFEDIADYNKRLAKMKAKQIVSTYLDEVVGIPGIKFLDAESRTEPTKALEVNGKQYTRDELIAMKDDKAGIGPYVATLRHVLRHGLDKVRADLQRRTDELMARMEQIERESAERYNVAYDEAKGKADAKARAEALYDAEQLRWLDKQSIKVQALDDTRTRNLVVFNDKNIFRVGGQAAANKDRMRFGKEMSARLNEGLDNVLPASVSKPAKSVVTNLATAAKNGLLAAGITEDIVNMAGKYMRSAQDYLTAQYARQKTRLDFEQKIESILDAFDKLPKALQGEGAGSVNRYILDSTMAKKWGYYPGEHRIGTTLFEVDPDLEKRFNAFPADAQQVIRDVFEHGYTALKAKSDAIDAAVEREFAERTKAAQGDADLMDEVAQAKKLMRSQLGKIQNVDFTTPYAYLGRYGDYVVAAKSAEFKYWEGVAAEKGENKERAAAWLAENVSNPDHYVVQFAETQGEADQIAADLMATGKFDMDGTEAGPKEDVGSFIGSDVHLAVARLRNLITRQGGEDGEGTAELNRMVSDLYLMTAAENSARKSEIMRKYVSGANGNMMRNLATSGRADAHFLSTMKHNDEVIDALERMRNEAKNNIRNAMPLYNELFKRQTNSLEYKSPSTLSHTLTQATSLWFLSTSPAFYLQQLLQTTVLSLPYMSGRLGYFRSVRAIKGAYRDVGALVKGLNVNEHIDFSKAPADVRAMLQTLVGMGKIDIGIDADAKARAGENNVLNTVMRKLQGVNNRIEAVNRATAAIAAYRGYIQRYGAGNADAATKFAAEVVSNTHGSYDGFNTPRILSSDAGRLVGQFKRFQIIQLSMLGKLINTSFKGASPEERVVARRALSFITGHMAVVGGALGVPFVQQVGSLLLSAFGDDDEPKDLEYKLRQAIGDETMANLLLNGVPAAAGVNLGGKLGMGNVASILPFTDVDLSTRSGYEKVVVGLMGPFFGGLAPKMVDGAGMMAKGEYYKGLELLMPNGIGNAMKGVRYANEGVTMRNGDVVLKPEEISMVDAAFQSVGLPTTTITGRQYAQKVTAEFDQFYSAKAAEIKGAYVNANRAGDTEGMAEARKDWEDLQASRKRNGYKIQPMSELFKAMVSARKREAGVVEGVETSKANKEFVKNII